MNGDCQVNNISDDRRKVFLNSVFKSVMLYGYLNIDFLALLPVYQVDTTAIVIE